MHGIEPFAGGPHAEDGVVRRRNDGAEADARRKGGQGEGCAIRRPFRLHEAHRRASCGEFAHALGSLLGLDALGERKVLGLARTQEDAALREGRIRKLDE